MSEPSRRHEKNIGRSLEFPSESRSEPEAGQEDSSQGQNE